MKVLVDQGDGVRVDIVRTVLNGTWQVHPSEGQWIEGTGQIEDATWHARNTENGTVEFTEDFESFSR